VFMTKWDADSLHRDTIGFGLANLDSAAVYTEFNISLSYFAPEAPDSAMISLDPSMLNRIPQVQFSQPDGSSSFFTVDNLRFEGGTLGTNGLSAERIGVYPNPVTDVLHFGDFSGTLSIRDASGRICMHPRPVDPGTGIPVAELPAGMYFLELSGNGTLFHSSIIKQ
jgi:hypothetical protein